MTVTINGTDGVSAVAANAVGTGDIQSGAVSQANLAAGIAGTGPAFSAYMNGSQNGISATTNTKVQFNATHFDTSSCFNTSTYRFTPNVAGYYQISANANLQSTTSTDSVTLQLYKNGSLYKISGSAKPAALTFATPTLSVLVYCNGSTDYLEIYAYLDVVTSGNLYAPVGDTFRSQFSGCLVRAA